MDQTSENRNGKHTQSFPLTCSKQSRVPWYRAAPLWFIMRVRTTSTGLEVKAPARPHTKLDLRESEKAGRAINRTLFLPTVLFADAAARSCAISSALHLDLDPVSL